MEIKYAVLHSTIFIPGPGGKGFTVGPTLSTSDTKGKELGIKMSLENNLLLLVLESKATSTMLPLTSVLHMVAAPSNEGKVVIGTTK